MNNLISLNPLFFAFIFPAISDAVLTLVGQSAEYWSKKRIVNEASPVYYVLKKSPWFFVVGSFVWFIFWYKILLLLDEPWTIFISIVFIAGHFWGSSSWILKMMREKKYFDVSDQKSVMAAWSILIVYLCIVAGIATYCILMYFS